MPSVEQPVRSVLLVLSEGGGSRACWVKETHIAVHFATCLASLLPCCHAAMLASQAGGGGVDQLCLDIDRSTPGLVDQESFLVESFFQPPPFFEQSGGGGLGRRPYQCRSKTGREKLLDLASRSPAAPDLARPAPCKSLQL